MGAVQPVRVFVDANVLFSACKPRSAMRRLVQALLKRRSAVASRYVLAEVEANLRAKRSEWLPHWLVVRNGMIVEDLRADVRVAGLVEKDLPVVQAAVASGCTHLVTGDQKHFGRWMGKDIRGVRVVSPRMLAEALEI